MHQVQQKIKKQPREKGNIRRPESKLLDDRAPTQRGRELFHLPEIADPPVGQDPYGPVASAGFVGSIVCTQLANSGRSARLGVRAMTSKASWRTWLSRICSPSMSSVTMSFS